MRTFQAGRCWRIRPRCIARVKSDLLASRQTLRAFYEMNYVLVPDEQPRLTIPFFNYPDESDLDGGTFPNGRYPIPPNMPVEGWPKATGDRVSNNGSRTWHHTAAIAIRSSSLRARARFGKHGWPANDERLGSLDARVQSQLNALRPAGWTSGDAGGLPCFPRWCVTTNASAARSSTPATGRGRDAARIHLIPRIITLPRSGQLGRLPGHGRAFPAQTQLAIPDAWTIEEKAVLRALKKYGEIVADTATSFR